MLGCSGFIVGFRPDVDLCRTTCCGFSADFLFVVGLLHGLLYDKSTTNRSKWSLALGVYTTTTLPCLDIRFITARSVLWLKSHYFDLMWIRWTTCCTTSRPRMESQQQIHKLHNKYALKSRMHTRNTLHVKMYSLLYDLLSYKSYKES